MSIVDDECSATIYDEAVIDTHEDLVEAIGATVINSFIVKMLTDHIANMDPTIEEGDSDE